jgi:hypothetical protein
LEANSPTDSYVLLEAFSLGADPMTEERSRPKLGAIFNVDVKGYDPLIRGNQEETIRIQSE